MALTSFNAPDYPLFESLGGCLRFTFKELSAVISIPVAVEQNIVDDIVISGNWLEGYATLERLRFVEREDRTDDGILYKTSLKGFVPGDRPDNAELFRKLKHTRCIIVARDSNGKQRLIGELGNGAKFTYQYDSEGKLSGLPGYEFEWFWESSRPAYHYQGNIPAVVPCPKNWTVEVVFPDGLDTYVVNWKRTGDFTIHTTDGASTYEFDGDTFNDWSKSVIAGNTTTIVRSSSIGIETITLTGSYV